MKVKFIILSLAISIALNFNNQSLGLMILGSVSMGVFLFITLILLISATERIGRKKFLGAALKIVSMTIMLMLVFILHLAFHQKIVCDAVLPGFQQNTLTGSCSFEKACSLEWYTKPGCDRPDRIEILRQSMDWEILTEKCNELCRNDKETFCGGFIPNLARDVSCDELMDCGC